MYVVIRTDENNEIYNYFRMLANNGIICSNKLSDAIMFDDNELANKQCDVLNGISDNIYEVRHITLEESEN